MAPLPIGEKIFFRCPSRCTNRYSFMRRNVRRLTREIQEGVQSIELPGSSPIPVTTKSSFSTVLQTQSVAPEPSQPSISSEAKPQTIPSSTISATVSRIADMPSRARVTMAGFSEGIPMTRRYDQMEDATIGKGVSKGRGSRRKRGRLRKATGLAGKYIWYRSIRSLFVRIGPWPLTG